MRIKIALILTAFSLSACGQSMFARTEQLLFKYKIDDKNTIEVFWVGSGATTKDYTEIRKVGPLKSDLIKSLEGAYNAGTISIVPIEKNVYKITFTDTLDFKGMSRSFRFNINDREKLYYSPGYEPKP